MPFASYVNFAIRKLLKVFNSKNYYLSSDSNTNSVICEGNDYPQRCPSVCQDRQDEFQTRDEASSINICSQTAKGKLFEYFSNEVETS